MEQYQRILVAVDGSKEADRALQRGISLAKRYNSFLYFCHVVESTEHSRVWVYREELKQAAVESGLDILKTCVMLAEEAGVKEVDTILKHGASPQKTIVEEVVSMYRIDLVITGASGLGPVEGYLLGSVAGGLVHDAACDVLVVKNRESHGLYQRILVAIDESDVSMKGFQEAIRMARDHQSHITAVHVLHTPLAHSVQQYRENIQDVYTKSGQLLLERYQQAAVEKDMQDMSMSLAYGTPTYVIPREAARHDQTDLIVAGATGAGAEKGIHLGSVSEGIVRRSACDVLIIRKEEL